MNSKVKPVILLLLFISLINWSVIAASGPVNPLTLSVTSLNGNRLSLESITTDKPVYLKFWATWCQPCREQMPHLQDTFDKYGSKINIIAVNLGINDSVAAVIKIKKEFGLNLPIVIDDSGRLAQQLNLLATPYHILLDENRKVVFKGHEATEQLDKAIQQLAEGSLPVLDMKPVSIGVLPIDTAAVKPSLLFFTSAWCDWYLEESRPVMSTNCISAQKSVNELYKKYPDLNWSGILTRLWTSSKELAEYEAKYKVEYPLMVDLENELFISYGVKHFPTLVVVSAGKELFRIEDFSDSRRVSNMFRQFDKVD